MEIVFPGVGVAEGVGVAVREGEGVGVDVDVRVAVGGTGVDVAVGGGEVGVGVAGIVGEAVNVGDAVTVADGTTVGLWAAAGERAGLPAGVGTEPDVAGLAVEVIAGTGLSATADMAAFTTVAGDGAAVMPGVPETGDAPPWACEAQPEKARASACARRSSRRSEKARLRD